LRPRRSAHEECDSKYDQEYAQQEPGQPHRSEQQITIFGQFFGLCALLHFSALDADLHFPLHLKQIFSELSVERLEKIGDREVYMISGIRPGHRPVRLYFDKESGLLFRQMRYSESPLGDNPIEIDYDDYRQR
jgi:hypothetical protein